MEREGTAVGRLRVIRQRLRSRIRRRAHVTPHHSCTIHLLTIRTNDSSSRELLITETQGERGMDSWMTGYIIYWIFYIFRDRVLRPETTSRLMSPPSLPWRARGSSTADRDFDRRIGQTNGTDGLIVIWRTSSYFCRWTLFYSLPPSSPLYLCLSRSCDFI